MTYQPRSVAHLNSPLVFTMHYGIRIYPEEKQYMHRNFGTDNARDGFFLTGG